jgi:hypothetical protein
LADETERLLARWRTVFHGPRELAWQGRWLDNGYCRDCRYCCGPQETDEPYPMALLPSQQGPEAELRFHLLSPDTAYLDGRGCKSATPTGCGLPRDARPVACNLFPLALVNGEMHLYRNCPVTWLVALARTRDIARNAARWLSGMPPSDLHCVDRTLPPQAAALQYIPLGIRIRSVSEEIGGDT